MRRYFFTLASVLALTSDPVWAQDALPALADVGLEKRIEALDGATGHDFELGMLQTLRAVERALQSGYEYGLSGGMLEIPVLRLFGDEPNMNARKPEPDSLAVGVAQFLADLDRARAYLDRIPDGEDQSFDLTLQDIWFDIDRSGGRWHSEGAVEMLAPEILGWRGMQAVEQGDLLDQPITIHFDAADQAWLAAYTHMLSGIGEAILAFDPAPVLTDLEDATAVLLAAPEIENPYDQAEVKATIARLQSQLGPIKAAIDKLRTARDAKLKTRRDLRKEWSEAASDADKERLDKRIKVVDAEIDAMDEEWNALWRKRREIDNAIEDQMVRLTVTVPSVSYRTGFEFELDSIYILIKTLRQPPDKGRAKAVQKHWKAMIRHNRDFWALLAQETDNDREWIPNPQQTSALPLDLPEGTAEMWLNVLNDAESVLDGKLLVPHPLLPHGYGVNVGAWFEDPSSLDIVDWIHGRGAYPYAARGPHVSDRNWRLFNQLVSGNAGSFAIFLN